MVQIDSEPDELWLSSVMAAAELGPVITVVPEDRQLAMPELAQQQVTSLKAGLCRLRERVNTETVMMLHAGAVQDADSVQRSADMIAGNIGWITGTTRTLSGHDSAECSHQVRARRRALIRQSGGAVWEPDATIVRSELVADVAPSPSAVLGDWLRCGARNGYRGIETNEILAFRLQSPDGAASWAGQVQNRRACAADVNRAFRAGPMRARPAELSSLFQQLYAWPLLAWAAVPLVVVYVGRFPLRIPAWTFWSAALALGALRWCSSRLAYGLALRPISESRSMLTDMPGSVAATVAAATGRLRPPRRAMPPQPLLVFAAGLSLATTMAFVDTRSPGTSVVEPVAIGITQLVWVWTCAAQSIARGAWTRRTYRVHPDWKAEVRGRPVAVVDASPGGVSVFGPVTGVGVGDSVGVSFSFHDGTTVSGRGKVVHKHDAPGSVLLGLSLELGSEQRYDWTRQLVKDRRQAKTAQERGGTATVDVKTRTARPKTAYLDLVVLVFAAALAVSTLTVIGLGLRPLFISSQSMRPALSAGDLVIEMPVPIVSVHAGNIVSLGPQLTRTHSLTHRVRDISTNSTSVSLETRGDANNAGEVFILPRTATVQRVLFKVPLAGRALQLIGSTPARLAADGFAALLLATVTIRWCKRSAAARGRRSAFGRDKTCSSRVPAASATAPERDALRVTWRG